ncbi:secretory carrier-associated membrane protein 5-like [Paramacrobiotus metropolitanus]|uniref:secretory carrier-associated membrane protein 5-like n=1 Tax=Paramacrobiotus metropolitanus TaxID=2943436 RepID=UPI00244655BA|nr:secretory carrier-associated membrane protein 5-like [Paramacrobiotus metropolitanus]
MASSQNPFGDPESVNPFGEVLPRSPMPADSFTPTFLPPPTVNAPARSPQPPNQPSSRLAFYEDSSVSKQPAYGTMTSQPGGSPPAYMDTARASTDELRRRQEELERRAAELDRREAELRNSPQDGVKRNNFPPLPKFCCFRPCFYQDFELDIPMGYRTIVRLVFYCWMVYSLMILINLVASIAYLCLEGNTAATTFGLSILWVVLFPVISFLFWYRPAYKAFRSDSSLNFFVFFCVFATQICVNIVQALGINPCGTCGIINGLSMITKGGASNVGVGAFMLCVGIVFGILAGCSFLLFVRIHRIYRTTGASFSKAQQEFASRAVQNEHVQNAAIGVARASVEEAARSGRF